MRIDIFEVGAGFGYAIVDANGSICIFQGFDPDEPGEQPMTREVAEAKADIVLARLTSE